MKLNILSTVKEVSAKQLFFLKRNSSTILVVSGVVGGVVSGIMACVATLKTPEIVKDLKDDLEYIRENAEDEMAQITENDVRKDTVKAYAECTGKLALLYLPSISLAGLSIAAIFSSHSIMNTRNAALAAAYSTLDSTFRKYRQRVLDNYGEEVEHRIMYDIHDEYIEETVVDDKGKEKKIKKKIQVSGFDGVSGYARYFMKYDSRDPLIGSVAWDQSKHYQEAFLSQQEMAVNNKLVIQGYLLLNDVYDELGFARTKAGLTVGWIYDADRPNGDNYIKFIRTKVYKKDADGNMQDSILIDFNVDGDIVSLATKKNLILDY